MSPLPLAVSSSLFHSLSPSTPKPHPPPLSRSPLSFFRTPHARDDGDPLPPHWNVWVEIQMKPSSSASSSPAPSATKRRKQAQSGDQPRKKKPKGKHPPKEENLDEDQDNQDTVRVTNDSPPDLILHSSWKFLNAFNFCTVFRSSLGLPRFGIHDLEAALGAIEYRDEGEPREQREISIAPSHGSSSNVSTPVPSGPSDGSFANAAFLAEFMSRLLQHITPNNVVLKLNKDKRQVTPTNWETYLRAILRPFPHPHGSTSSLSSYNGEDDDDIDELFPEDVAFHALPTYTKIELLRRVCDRVFEEGAETGFVRELDTSELRSSPIGTDEKGRSYWIFGATRLYREQPLPKFRKQGSTPPMSDYTFELLARTPEDWHEWMERFKTSRKVVERSLHEMLCEYGEEAIAEMEAQKVARAREKERLEKLRLLEAMPKKRSSRIESKKKEVEEHQRAEEMRRIESEQAEQRLAEKDRARRDKKKAEREAVKTAEKKLDIEVRDLLKTLLVPTSSTLASDAASSPAATPPPVVVPTQRVTRHGGVALRQPSEESEPPPSSRRRLLDDLGKAMTKLKETVALIDDDVRPRVVLRETEELEELQEFEQKGKGKVEFPEFGRLKIGFDVNQKDITNTLLKFLLREIVSLLLSQPCADDFAVPVDIVKFRIFDYPKIVKRPMDLSTMHKKLMFDRYNTSETAALDEGKEESDGDNNGETTPLEDNSRTGFIGFVADLRQIVWNCVIYNREESSISHLARELEWLAARMLRCLFGGEEWDEEAWKRRREGGAVKKTSASTKKEVATEPNGRDGEKAKKRERVKQEATFDLSWDSTRANNGAGAVFSSESMGTSENLPLVSPYVTTTEPLYTAHRQSPPVLQNDSNQHPKFSPPTLAGAVSSSPFPPTTTPALNPPAIEYNYQQQFLPQQSPSHTYPANGIPVTGGPDINASWDGSSQLYEDNASYAGVHGVASRAPEKANGIIEDAIDGPEGQGQGRGRGRGRGHEQDQDQDVNGS